MNQVALISVHGDPTATPGSIQSGGQNVYVRQLAMALDQLGWEVDVFTHRTDAQLPSEELLGRHSRVVRLDGGRPGFLPKGRMFALLPAFLSEVQDWAGARGRNYRAIHSNYWLSGWVSLRLRQRWGIPQVHTFHSLGRVRAAATPGAATDPTMLIRLQVERSLVRFADRIIATNPVERSLLTRLYAAAPDRIAVVPCGVNPEVFYPRDTQQSRAELGLAGLRPLMFAGRFEHNKGLAVLLEALAGLLTERPGAAESIRLLVAGGPPPAQQPPAPELAQIRAQMATLGLEPYVAFLGPQSHQALARYFAAAEVTVVPSYYETFGMVALEAMACGCPVVASQVGGLTYTVRDGETGLLVPPGDAAALTRALIRVVDRDAALVRARQSLARGPEDIFTWPEIAASLAELYLELAQREDYAAGAAKAAAAPGVRPR